MREIKGSGRKVCSVLFCTALHCNCDLRLRRSRCTPGELQFDLSWGLILIYLYMAGIHRLLYTKWLLSIFRVYHKITTCIWEFRIVNGCWHGQRLRTGRLWMSRGCREGYGALLGAGAINPQPHERLRTPHHGLIKAIKGSDPQSLVWSGRRVRIPRRWSAALFPGIAPFWMSSHKLTSSASVIAWCMGESFVLSPRVASYKSPGPLDMSLGSSSGWVEWYIIEYISILVPSMVLSNEK